MVIVSAGALLGWTCLIDLFIADYQLGNGKRSSLAVPQHLPPLINRLSAGLSAETRRETSMSSGTVSIIFLLYLFRMLLICPL